MAAIPLLRAEGIYCEFSRSFSLLFVSQSCGWRIIPYDPLLLLLSCHRENLERGGKSLNPSQTALCLLCGTSPTVSWGVKGRQWEKEISQYHKHIIVTVFTIYALQKPTWNLFKIDATDLERQKNEKGNKTLSYCYATPVSETWVCIDKQHAIKIAKAVANFFFYLNHNGPVHWKTCKQYHKTKGAKTFLWPAQDPQLEMKLQNGKQPRIKA